MSANKLTDEEVTETIMRVVNRMAHKYTFVGFEVDDMKQEGWIICNEAMPRWDGNRPLENFLSVHLSNRFKNFVRDNYWDSETDRGKVSTPAQLTGDLNIVGNTRDLYADACNHEMVDLIDTKLPAKYRGDYLKIVNDVYVPKKQREEVLKKIEGILRENGYE